MSQETTTRRKQNLRTESPEQSAPNQAADPIKMAGTAAGHALGQVYSYIDQLESEEDNGPIQNGVDLRNQANLLAQELESRAQAPTHSRDLEDAILTIARTLRNIAVLASMNPETKLQYAKVLSEDYERVIALMRADPQHVDTGSNLNTLRPKNYVRNVFHVFNACLSVFTYEMTSFETCMWIIFGIIVFCVVIELCRRLIPSFGKSLFDRILAPITRPRERYIIPASTWYALGILIVLVLCEKTIAQVAVLVLGVGDPSATLVGKRFGRRFKIYRQKSLAGSSAFVAVSTIVVYAFLFLCRPLYSFPYAVAMSLCAGVVGAVAELFSDDTYDDNITVPLAVALLLSLTFHA